MAWKNIEEVCSAPWLMHTTVSQADLVYVSMCEVVRCVCVWTCVPLHWALVLPSFLPCCAFIQTERNQTTPTASIDPSAILSLMFFLFPLVLNLSLIYEAFLCGCVTWFDANREWGRMRQRERERGRGLSCWVSCPTVRSYFSARFMVVGSWLIVGPLSSFRHAWPMLISPVHSKPALITLHTIKANFLIMACLIINSHWDNEWSDLTSVILHMWLRNKSTCL